MRAAGACAYAAGADPGSKPASIAVRAKEGPGGNDEEVRARVTADLQDGCRFAGMQSAYCMEFFKPQTVSKQSVNSQPRRPSAGTACAGRAAGALGASPLVSCGCKQRGAVSMAMASKTKQARQASAAPSMVVCRFMFHASKALHGVLALTAASDTRQAAPRPGPSQTNTG